MTDSARLTSGVAGLDVITRGGFFRAAVYMLLARPGSGKTILANQIGFHHVAHGGRTVYITLLAESHARMLSALRPLAFFDPNVVGTSMTYLSGYEALETKKLKGLLEFIRTTVREQRATLLVIDGLVTAGGIAESALDSKKFIHGLQTFAELSGCTTLILTGTRPEDQFALRTMVDGLLELSVEAVGMDAARTIEVTKLRGGPMLLGKHFFEITSDGITIYPRTEARYAVARATPERAPTSRATFGIPALDAMLGGGVRASSTTALLGASGSGKTLLGLSFLAAGARAGEDGLYFGFSERASVLCRRADDVGLGLTAHVESGLVEVIARSPRAVIADALVDQMLAAVRERAVRRLFIDGIESFADALVYSDRTRSFFGALRDELEALGVVTVFSGMETPKPGLVAMLDYVVAIRHVGLHKQIAVVKMRDGEADGAPRDLVIGRNGIIVSPVAEES